VLPLYTKWGNILLSLTLEKRAIAQSGDIWGFKSFPVWRQTVGHFLGRSRLSAAEFEENKIINE
jgi:hypothetical protein